MGEELASELAEVFSRVGPALHKWLRAGVDHEGVTFARMRLMWALRCQGPSIMSELKDELGVTARNVTALVDGLEDEGFVERQPHPEDRRATLVELTDDGQRVVDKVHSEHLERAAALFEHLEEDDQAQLLALMRQLLGILEGAEPGTGEASA